MRPWYMIDHDPVWCGFTLVAFTTSGRTQAYMYTTLDALYCTLHTHTTRLQSCSTVRQILQSWSSNHYKLQLHEKFLSGLRFWRALHCQWLAMLSSLRGRHLSLLLQLQRGHGQERLPLVPNKDLPWPAPTCATAGGCLGSNKWIQMKIVYASQGGRIRHRLDSPTPLSLTKREYSVGPCGAAGPGRYGFCICQGDEPWDLQRVPSPCVLSHDQINSKAFPMLLQVTLPKNSQERRADGTLGIKSRKLASASWSPLGGWNLEFAIAWKFIVNYPRLPHWLVHKQFGRGSILPWDAVGMSPPAAQSAALASSASLASSIISSACSKSLVQRRSLSACSWRALKRSFIFIFKPSHVV